MRFGAGHGQPFDTTLKRQASASIEWNPPPLGVAVVDGQVNANSTTALKIKLAVAEEGDIASCSHSKLAGLAVQLSCAAAAGEIELLLRNVGVQDVDVPRGTARVAVSKFGAVDGPPVKTDDTSLPQIIDGHVHLADLARVKYTGAIPTRNYSLADYAGDAAGSALPPAGLVMVTLTEAAGETADMLAQPAWVQSLVPAAHEPAVLGIVAQAPLERGRGVGPFLDELLRVAPKVRGVRLALSEAPSLVPSPSALAAAMVELAARQLALDVLAKPEQLPRVLQIAEAAPPHLSIVLNHLGAPPFPPSPPANVTAWSNSITALGQHPNVFCKVSGTPREPWTDDDVRPFISHVLASFGWSRVLFAGNWYVVEEHSSFGHWAAAVARVVVDNATVSAEQKAALLSGTAQRVYRLPSLPA